MIKQVTLFWALIATGWVAVTVAQTRTPLATRPRQILPTSTPAPTPAVSVGPDSAAPRPTAATTPSATAGTPSPAAVSASSAAGTPAPAAATPGPAVATPGPAVATPGPAVATPGPAVAVSANSAAATPGPAAASLTAAAQSTAPSSTDTPKFTSEAKWELAGYNNDEVVYTVFVTSQDARIIRCTTEVKGFYFENGTKLSISDRQITTVFPNQPTRVGYWMDMDQQSGATYSVKCHAV